MDFDNSTGTISGVLVLDSASTTPIQIAGTNALVVPVGNTAARPGSPVDGAFRYNSETAAAEIFYSSGWKSIAASTSGGEFVTTNGLVARTAANAYTGRTLTQPAAGITVSNGDGVSGNPTLALANDLAALEGLASTGLAARTAADTWAQRTITGTTNRLTVTNGDGVSGNPTLDISSSYVGQASITTLGTITSGTWNGTDIALANIAQIATSSILGRTTASTGDIEVLTGTQATALLDAFTSGAKGLAPASGGGTTNFLRADGTWAAPGGGGGAVSSVTVTQPAAGITITNTGVAQTGATSSTLALANDLAGLEGLASTGIAARTAADTWAVRTVTGTTNRLTVTNGDGVSGNPTLDISSSYVGQATITTLGTITTGVWNGTDIAVADGGTGVGTLTGTVIGNGTSAFTAATSSTVGQVLRCTGANTFAYGAVDLADTDAITGDLPFANLTQGSALSVLGVTGNATADVASIAAGADANILRRSGTTVAFGTIDLAASGAVGTSRLPFANHATVATASTSRS